MAKLRCPTCDTSVNVKEEKIGSSVLCDACGEKFVAKSATSSRRDLDDDEDRPARSSRRRDDEDDVDDYDDEPRPKKKKKFKAKSRSNTNAAAFVFAGAIFLGLISVVGGLAFYFASKKPPLPPPPVAVGPNMNNAPMAPMGPNPNRFAPLPAGGGAPQPQPNNPQAPPGMPQMQPGMPQPQPGAVGEMKATLSNPRWSTNGLSSSFDVDYNFTSGRPIGGRYSIRFKTPDGQSGSARLIGILDKSGSVSIKILGTGGQIRGPIEIWMEEGGFPGPFGKDGTAVSNRVTLN